MSLKNAGDDEDDCEVYAGETENNEVSAEETENNGETEHDEDPDLSEDFDCNNDYNDHSYQAQPRRSTRVTNKPPYLNDYIMIAEVESEHLLMIMNDESWSYVEAKELKVWVDACKDEIFSIEKKNTWDLVELPASIKPIGLKCVFKIKRNAD